MPSRPPNFLTIFAEKFSTHMKRIFLIIALSVSATAAIAQDHWQFTEASDLNIIGKILDGTPNPYHRVDTVKYKGFTNSENIQVRCPAGLAVLFKTDSDAISVKTEYGWEYKALNTMPLSYRGYDLYIKKTENGFGHHQLRQNQKKAENTSSL